MSLDNENYVGGFLLRHTQGALRKATRAHWYVLDKPRCLLFECANRQLAKCSEFVDLVHANLLFDEDSKSRSVSNSQDPDSGQGRTFAILYPQASSSCSAADDCIARALGKRIVLQAEDHVVMMQWFSQIQAAREAYKKKADPRMVRKRQEMAGSVQPKLPQVSDGIVVIGASEIPSSSMLSRASQKVKKALRIRRSDENFATSSEDDPYIQSLRDEIDQLTERLDESKQRLKTMTADVEAYHVLKASLAGDDTALALEIDKLTKEHIELKARLATVTEEKDKSQENYIQLKSKFCDALQKRDQDANVIAQLSARMRELKSKTESGGSEQGMRQESELAAMQAELVTFNNLRQEDMKQSEEMKEQMMQARQDLRSVWKAHLELLSVVANDPQYKDRVQAMVRAVVARDVQGGLGDSRDGDEGEEEEEGEAQGGEGSEGKQIYNRYGFPANLDPRVTLKLLKTEQLEEENGLKWDQFLEKVGSGHFDVDRKDETLKSLVRNGIPDRHRRRVWAELIHHVTKKSREWEGPHFYQKLLKQKEGKTSVATKQIELDLRRTFPHHRDFGDENSEKLQQLRRVLVVYSWRNPQIGYCQGMNMIVALLLLFLDEENAFWGLASIVEHHLPKGYFSPTMEGAQTDQRVLKDIFSSKCPKLNAHLDRHEVDIGLLTFQFFLTAAIDAVPIEATVRIWDCFLLEGEKVLFRFSLALLRMLEPKLLRMDDRAEMFMFMRDASKKVYDIAGLVEYAFSGLNGFWGFSKRVIDEKRVKYQEEVRREMVELEKQRTKMREEREQQQQQQKSQVSSLSASADAQQLRGMFDAETEA